MPGGWVELRQWRGSFLTFGSRAEAREPKVRNDNRRGGSKRAGPLGFAVLPSQFSEVIA